MAALPAMSRRTVVSRRAVVILMSVLVAAPACATARSGHSSATSTTLKPVVYVAVGASETVGVGADDPATQAWPTVFNRAAGFPPGSRYVNVGISGARVQTALDKELAAALKEGPTVVTVWLNVNDILARVPVASYETQLRTLVHGLRQGGQARVLVANTPPLEILPQVRPFAAVVGAYVDPYNEAIARVVQGEGAELVDLHAAGLAAEQAGTAASLVGKDGFHPSTAGHAAVAAEFAKAYRSGAAR
jgi:acyl-CoA thioesterase-1